MDKWAMMKMSEQMGGISPEDLQAMAHPQGTASEGDMGRWSAMEPQDQPAPQPTRRFTGSWVRLPDGSLFFQKRYSN